MDVPDDIMAAAERCFDGADPTRSVFDNVVAALKAEREAQKEKDAVIAANYKRDASFDDSMVGALEHNSNQMNIAAAIRGQ